MSKIEEIAEKHAPNFIGHYDCEDSWYACPRSEGGCANDAEGDNCTCGYVGKMAAFKSALRDLLDRCVAEVEAEMCVYDVALAVTKRKADALEKVKSRLARLGESGESQSKSGAGPRE